MPWIQLIFETEESQTQTLSDALTELGALAVTLQDGANQPLFEPPPGTTPLWSQTRVVGLFDANIDIEHLTQKLSAHLAPRPLPAWRAEPLEDKDWEREWMDNYQPIRFGERLWIVPSWHTPPHPEAVNILLDPGLAFGTGTHPTTALCLEWLDAHLQPGIDVIDYGCGSGILAIAALLLGAEKAIAVDNDPQALLATRNNAEHNGVLQHLVIAAPAQLGTPCVDLLLANILAQPLIELAAHFANLVKPGGQIVLSGILREQADSVSSAYTPWFDMAPATVREDWVRLSGRRTVTKAP
jgi:ribosomal protein L11 methyltransferase